MGTTMTPKGAIPPILVDALNTPDGYVIVLSGEPGTGKSMLAREVFMFTQDSFMILTSQECCSASGERFVDSPDWESRHVAIKTTHTDTGERVQSTDMGDVLSVFVTDKRQVRDARVIIIDSWSELVETLHEPQRRRFEKELLVAAREQKKKLVIVSEDGQQLVDSRALHYSADSIIRLEKHRRDERVFRQLVIEKMRWFPVPQDSYLFTLDGGRFTYIPWHQHTYPPITVEREPIPDPSASRISTGNRSLDRLTGGGFIKGTLNLIEVEDLAAPYLETIYIPFLSNNLQLGRPAVILLPEGWSPERLTHGLEHFMDLSSATDRLVYFGRHALGRGGNVKPIDDDPAKAIQEIRYETGRLEREYGCPATDLFALDTLENKYGPSVVKGMVAELTAALYGTGRVTLTILSHHQSVKAQSLSHSVHLRVEELCGVISVAGINPRSNFLALRPLLSAGFLDYELTPIV
ncbi:MAG: AAA family ATPase [Candidatus Thorarchaeota archaeon]|nr:AAA family ATPase [Candidatus Thorarchaeota archaeon]